MYAHRCSHISRTPSASLSPQFLFAVHFVLSKHWPMLLALRSIRLGSETYKNDIVHAIHFIFCYAHLSFSPILVRSHYLSFSLCVFSFLKTRTSSIHMQWSIVYCSICDRMCLQRSTTTTPTPAFVKCVCVFVCFQCSLAPLWFFVASCCFFFLFRWVYFFISLHFLLISVVIVLFNIFTFLISSHLIRSFALCVSV